MSKVLKIKVPDCDNHYTAEDLLNTFGMDDKEIQICMKCKNCIIEDGIISCKHIMNNLEGVQTKNED